MPTWGLNQRYWKTNCGRSGSIWISNEKYIPNCKILAHLEFKSKVLPGPLTDLSAWVGFCNLYPTAGCQIATLTFEKKMRGVGGSLWVSHEKYIPNGKVLAYLRFQSRVFPMPLTGLCVWVGFCTSSPHRGVKYQLYIRKKNKLWRGWSL